MKGDGGTMSDGWLVYAISSVLSALVAYFTTTGTLQARLSQLEEREGNHYAEILRRIDHIDRKIDRMME